MVHFHNYSTTASKEGTGLACLESAVHSIPTPIALDNFNDGTSRLQKLGICKVAGMH